MKNEHRFTWGRAQLVKGCFLSQRMWSNLHHVCLLSVTLKLIAGWSKTKQDPGLQKNPEQYCGLGTFGLINVQPATSGNSVSKLSNEIRDYA